jgi:hypothetical protein
MEDGGSRAILSVGRLPGGEGGMEDGRSRIVDGGTRARLNAGRVWRMEHRKPVAHFGGVPQPVSISPSHHAMIILPSPLSLFPFPFYRGTASGRETLRLTARAITRTSSIRSANSAGVSDWPPSLSADAGS